MFVSLIGCHVDPNCASQTGIEVDDADACCAIRNRQSFRDPNDPDGRCTLCGGGLSLSYLLNGWLDMYSYS